jgi:hypothetical protein
MCTRLDECPSNLLASACALAILFAPVLAAVAEEGPQGPEISGIWGERGPGSEINILGTGFGEAEMQVESSLGPAGWIESTSPGTAIGKIDLAQEWGTFATRVAPFIGRGRAHSGDNAVDASVDRGADGDWQKVLHYAHPQRSRAVYGTWWVLFEPKKAAERTQWKMWRLTDDAGPSIVNNNCGSPYQNSYWNSEGVPFEYVTLFQCQNGCDWPAGKRCTAEVRPEPWYAPRYGDPLQYRYHNRADSEAWSDNLPEPGVWCRFEFFLQASDLDVPNGRFWFAIHKPGMGRRIIDNWVDGLLTHTSDCCSDSSQGWQHFVLQGYWDDNGGEFDDEEATILYDDIYLQFGSQARVELGNAPSMAASTQLEVQEVLTWTDTSLMIRLNHGGLDPTKPAWIFVVDDVGAVSPGMPIRLEPPADR